MLSKALAFLKRDFLIESSYRLSFTMGLTRVPFNLFMFWCIGRLLSRQGDGRGDLYHGDYFSFVVVGLAVSDLAGTGLTTLVTRFREELMIGTMTTIFSMPISPGLFAVGSCLWGVADAAVRAGLYLVLAALLFGAHFHLGGLPLFAALMLLCVLSFTGLGVLGTSFIVVLKKGDPVSWVGAQAARLLGGTYFPVSVMPGWAQALAYVLPTTHALNAGRAVLLAGAGLDAIWTELLFLAVFASVILPLGVLTFNVAVARARRDGTLGHY